MPMAEEFTISQAAVDPAVGVDCPAEHKVKSPKALRWGTQWFIPYDVLALVADYYDSKTDKRPHLL